MTLLWVQEFGGSPLRVSLKPPMLENGVEADEEVPDELLSIIFVVSKSKYEDAVSVLSVMALVLVGQEPCRHCTTPASFNDFIIKSDIWQCKQIGEKDLLGCVFH